MSTKSKDRVSTSGGVGGKGGDEVRRTTVATEVDTMSAERQEEIERELRESMEQREISISSMSQLTEKVSDLPDRVAGAVEESMRRALAEDRKVRAEAMAVSGEQPPEIKYVERDPEPGLLDGLEDRSFFVKVPVGAWRIVRPRKPKLEDVQPAVTSNLITWGGAWALSQVSSGASDFFVDLFAQGTTEALR